MRNCSIRELLVKEAHCSRLMGHFGITKILEFLHENFYWLNIKRYVKRVCDRCITCKQAIYKLMCHGCTFTYS